MSRKSGTEAPNWLALDHQLCFALYSASLSITKAYQPLLEPLGLTYPQYLVMLALWEQDDVTVSQLGERLHLDSGTLTPLLKRLEAGGHVQRQRDAADERRVRVTLTPSGRTLKRSAQRVPPAMCASLGCSFDEISTLTRRLTELRDHLQQPGV